MFPVRQKVTASWLRTVLARVFSVSVAFASWNAVAADPMGISQESVGAATQGNTNFHGASLAVPRFSFYYDALLAYRPHLEQKGAVSFNSFHQLFLMQMKPWDDLTFMAELSPNPRYFETDFEASKRFTVRWGKIWIPFDDLSPHARFGGRVNASYFLQGEELPFLPDVWTELGVGMKVGLIQGSVIQSVLDLYVVNGFDALPAGSDPAQSGAAYPDFSDAGVSVDNNSDKALGGRLHTLFGKSVGLGFSYYRNRWTDDGEPPRSLSLKGADIQFRPNKTTEFRTGLTVGEVKMPRPSGRESFSRGGFYFDAGFKFGQDLLWKSLIRGGYSQNDSRLVDASDRQIIGATVIRQFGSIEASLHYDRDFRRVPAKTTYDYGAFRIVAAF